MKYAFLALIVPILAHCALRADDDDEKNKAPPVEIPDFNNLDEYIYQPKSNLNFGFRFSAGIHATFSGNGQIAAPEAIPSLAANVSRTYHDGAVQPDARTMTVDNGNGTTSTVPIVPDGKTNTWNYTSSNQITPDGFMTFGIYSASTSDTGTHSSDRRSDMGWELSVAKDMGNINKRLSWKIFGGMSVNDIQAGGATPVPAAVTSIVDTYDLFGQTPPGAPYNAPSTNTQNVLDSNGNQVLDVNGNPVTQNIDTTTLLGNTPLNRNTSTTTNTTEVVDNYKVHGSYITFRGGPQLIYSFNDHIRVAVSVGPALIYSGSTYTVSEILTPATGDQIIDELSNTTGKLLFGYYGDATLQYELTDRTGFYLGAYLQSAGSYNQTASASGSAYGSVQGTGSYTTRVDFDDTTGIRSGMTFRF